MARAKFRWKFAPSKLTLLKYRHKLKDLTLNIRKIVPK